MKPYENLKAKLTNSWATLLHFLLIKSKPTTFEEPNKWKTSAWITPFVGW